MNLPNQCAGLITGQTLLTPAIYAWEYYLNDQGKSPHTVKAFISDINSDRVSSSGSRVGFDHNQRPEQFPWNGLKKDAMFPAVPKHWLGGSHLSNPSSSGCTITEEFPLIRLSKVPQRTVISPLPQVLSDEEVTAVLNTANQHRWNEKKDARPYTLVSLLLGTGIKKSECLGIHLNHLDLEAPEGPLVHIKYADQPIATKSARSACLKIGWMHTVNTWSNMSRWINCFPGRRGDWNICWRILATRPT